MTEIDKTIIDKIFLYWIMYYEPPYAAPPTTRAPLQFGRRRFFQNQFGLRCLGFVLCGICALLIIAAIIIVTIVLVVRNRDVVSSVLNYPEFICSQRPCGCPSYLYGRPFASKIVGGADAPPFTYPWLVALTDRSRTEPFCSGSIVSSRYVLTAAHCIAGRNPIDIQILSRLHDIRQFSGDRHEIESIFIHPQYRSNDSRYLNDIALIRIRSSFAGDLQPICLPSSQSFLYPTGRIPAVVGGWGRISPQGSTRNSPILQHVVLPIVDSSNSRCRQTIIDPLRQLCAGYDRLRIDTCAGDSGAPLLVVERTSRDQGNFIAAGIVSYGNQQCDSSVSSGVYTRVSSYLPWIQSIMAVSK